MKIQSLIFLSLTLSAALQGRADDISPDSLCIMTGSIDTIIDSIDPATENQKLAEALQAAIPFAEAGILADRSCFSADLDKVDDSAVNDKIIAISPLVPYSGKIASHVDNLNRFLEISRIYKDCAEFDNMPYSKELIDSIQSDLIRIFEMGEGITDASQKAQIDNLYEYTDAYLPAVEAFDELMKSIDTEVDLFRNNEQGDKLCANEIERIMAKSGDAVNRIADFRYLSDLLTRYQLELKASPRSLTPEIREELSKMLSQSNGPDNKSENDNVIEPEPTDTRDTEND
ncbi:MAG: hypothetical protein K2L73_00115 [Muribaculaceae bacterium]|nr:hypothetical protein [Muribaculaceae bacterium]